MRLSTGFPLLFWTACKRLYRNGIFFALLLGMLLLLLFSSLIRGREEGVLTVGILPKEAIGQKIARQLEEHGTALIRYMPCESEEEAKEKVERGEWDAAWIFEERLSEKIAHYGIKRTSLVKSYETKDSVLSELARNSLYRALYPYLSYSIYRNFMEKKLGNRLSEESLRSYYDMQHTDRDFLTIEDLSGTEIHPEKNLLLSPLRGLLSVWLFIASLIGGMLFLKEEKEGLYNHLPKRERDAFAFLSVLALLSHLYLLLFLLLFFHHGNAPLPREIIGGGFLVLTLACFSEIMRKLLCDLYRIAALLPALLLLSLLINPIFLDLPFGIVRFLSPVYPYLRYMRGGNAAVLSVYALALLLLSSGWSRVSSPGSGINEL